MSSLPEAACTASRHGTVNAYKNLGCRCPLAVRAWSRYMKDYRLRRLRNQPRLIDATGTRRRIRALHALGWTTESLGVRLGRTGNAVSQLARRDRVHPTTARKVAALYDALADHRGPSAYTEMWAQRQGYLPPLWYDDDTIDDPAYDAHRVLKFMCTSGAQAVDHIVVERLLDGQPPLHVTRAERAEAVRLLEARGKTRSEIAVQLHMSGGRVAQILDSFVRPAKHTPTTDNDRQEASA